MEKLKQAILEQGIVVGEDVLKVDSFLNHQIDPQLMSEIGQEFVRLFGDRGITKVVTIEVSGIAPAIFAGFFLSVPVVFAKKSQSLTLDNDVYTSHVMSFTKRKEYRITVEKKYITDQDTVLLIDDFLAVGRALNGLIDIVRQAGAKLAGCGIVIEKGFLRGGDLLREQGVCVQSLAIIESMADRKIIFRETPEGGNE